MDETSFPPILLYDTGPPADDEGGYHERHRPELIAIARPYGFGGRVLDLGCAGGVLGADLLDSGIATEVVGIEQNPDAAAMASGRITTVLNDDLTDPSLVDRLPHPFDAMVFADVLEHLPDPLPVLERMVKRLPTSGLCLISLPNVRYFRVVADLVLRNEWTYTPEGVCDGTHLRFFTARSAVRFCRDAGLQVLGLHVPLHARAARAARVLPPAVTFLSAHLVLIACPERGADPKRVADWSHINHPAAD